MKKQLSEQFKRMQKLAGINENEGSKSKYVVNGELDEEAATKYLDQYKSQDPEISPYDYFNDMEYGWSGEHNDAEVENMTDEEIEELLTQELSYYWYEDEDVLKSKSSGDKTSKKQPLPLSWEQDLIAELEMAKEDAWFGPSFDYKLIPANEHHKASWQYDLDKNKFESEEEHKQMLEYFLEEITSNIGGTYEISNIMGTDYGSVDYTEG